MDRKPEANYDNVRNSNKNNSNYIKINKWLLLGGIILAVLIVIAVGLGVYFGTKNNYTCPSQSTSVGSTSSLSTRPPTSQSTTVVVTPPTTSAPPTDIFLPHTLFPIEYILTIQTFVPSPTGSPVCDDSNCFTFNGNLTVLIHCFQDTNNVTMHMNNITIHQVALANSTNYDIPLVTDPMYTYDQDTQKISFNLAQGHVLQSGDDYMLTINYTGYLNDDLVGFYRSSYYESGYTNLQWLAITQFEPTDARRALPCFDEPSFKANFSLTLIHPSSMKALSNEIEESSNEIDNDWNVTVFKTTPKMSTYLFAMCVAAFESKEAISENQVLFRVWARPSFVEDAWYAAEMGPKVLTDYTDYFNISFPLPKQDMLAIPDLAFGGMENWGMITYRERDILVNNQSYAATNVQRTATVIAHELAHMWFGDLVTLAWWDDLWLNEGFAEFFEYYGADIISDTYFNMTDQFVPLEIGLTMQLDQLTSSHPIYDPSLITPDQINSAFDDISYDKGACIIRMLQQTVGPKVFRQGLIHYLTTHEYSNANHQDLWDAMQWAVFQTNTTLGWDGEPLNITELMNPWVVQMNFPVVTVNRDYNNKSAKLYQSRFLLPGNFTGNPNYQTSVYNFTWNIPIWYNQQSLEVNEENMWLEPYSNTFLNDLSSNEWLIVNSKVYVLYRVNYDKQNWQMLHQKLITSHQEIDVRNRAQLLDDALNLARAGLMDYQLALNTTLYLDKEFNYVPWLSVTPSLAYFQDMFALSQYYQYYGEYLKFKVQPIYNTLGWDDTQDPVNDVLTHDLRQFAISTMCQLEDSNCTDKALGYFKTFFQDCQTSTNGTSSCSNVPHNIRKPVYCTGIKKGGSVEFNYLFEKYPQEQVSVERDNILYGLCCTTAPWAINKLLTEAINPSSSFIRQQDVEYVFLYLGANDVGRTLLWPFFTNNWNALADLFASGFLGISDIIQASTRSFNTQNDVQQMQNFLNDNSNLGSGLPAFMQQMELAEANVAWMQNYAETVIEWFSANLK